MVFPSGENATECTQPVEFACGEQRGDAVALASGCSPMKTMNDSDILAKPEVQSFVERYRRELRLVAKEGSFAKRERAMLTITGEVTRGALEDELAASG